ncbi:MAG TPA: hypothetical protein VKU02_30900 [Gemmataceae bacterium]|nr:hypothetical protein [Gemmataceae bacterium]
MILFGHHTEAFLQIEIMGQPFPTGPMEHGIAFGVTGVALLLTLYGAYAAVRDLRRWLARRVRA